MRTRTKILLAIAALGLAVWVASSLRDRASELRFVAPAGERGEVDAGPSGPSLGDASTFAGPLLDDDGDPAGRIDGVCIVTSRPDDREERRQRCAVTLTVGTDNGETELQLAAVARAAADDVIF